MGPAPLSRCQLNQSFLNTAGRAVAPVSRILLVLQSMTEAIIHHNLKINRQPRPCLIVGFSSGGEAGSVSNRGCKIRAEAPANMGPGRLWRRT